ncbi:MAG: LptF/LptG family permease [Desulfobulbaceae bacterium]|uniref:LptF/LptG family permease n=1 Tax=Candidatus Desulfobia pelagia TaxID=2841692 RepID=A0A8J6TF25_9BACT|nr:LptF/LptG family permease [Candidatus Desulfobia pelagia]
MPVLLYTYILSEMIAPFLASLAILCAILFLGRLMPLLELFIQFGISMPDFIRLCLYMTPNLFIFAIPMASMLGVILCFSRLVNDNEMIAIKAAGTGLYRMLPPVIIFALGTTLLTGYAATKLTPAGSMAMQKLLVSLATDKFTKGLTEKQFSEGINDVVLYIDGIDKETGEWQGVYISDNRDKKNPLTIVAASGNFTGYPNNLLLTVQLKNGSIHQAEGSISQTIQFKDYTLNLSLHNPKVSGEKQKTFSGKKEMSQKQLLAYAREHGPDSEQSISRMIEYHKRLVLAAGCFILSIMGIPFAMRNRPGQRAVGMPLGLLFFVAYYISITAAKVASEAGMPVGLAMWTPNILFLIFTLYLLDHAHREHAEDILDKTLSLFTKISRLIPIPGRRRSS